MDRYKKLIFVCTGNTCRSPMAEAIYRNLEKVSEIKVVSRGLVVLFSEPINPKAKVILGKHDLDIKKHVSKMLKASDFDENTIILTMTRQQKKMLMERYPKIKNIYTIREFTGEDGDVADPYGGSLMEYEECYVELAHLVKKVVYKLNEDM